MTLADACKAVVHELGAQHCRAKFVHDGQVLATLETNEHDAGPDADGVYIVLSAGGVFSAHE
ncbi:hypothetical protein ACFVZD_18835 [Streptomyces sp. NPDC058287]|uniref:hypothetical protein n=1 Tax=unclassified Streptomyces TaxID=2593676 RepID=UPI0036EA58EA